MARSHKLIYINKRCTYNDKHNIFEKIHIPAKILKLFQYILYFVCSEQFTLTVQRHSNVKLGINNLVAYAKIIHCEKTIYANTGVGKTDFSKYKKDQYAHDSALFLV